MPFGERLAPFALDRLAVARIEGGEEIVETAVALVVPVELLVVALQEAVLGQKLPFGFARKGDVNRRRVGGAAERDQTARQGVADAVGIDAVADQQARSGGRREGNRGLQFRIIAAARALIGIGPAAVEHVFALRVRFQVAGHDAGDGAVEPGQQVPRSPAGARAGRSGGLQGREKGMRNKRVIAKFLICGANPLRNRGEARVSRPSRAAGIGLRIGAGIPVLSRNLADGRDGFEGYFG